MASGIGIRFDGFAHTAGSLAVVREAEAAGASQIWMAEHGASSLAFIAAIWVEGQNARQPSRTMDGALTAIYQTLREHDIEIPFPRLDLQLRGDESLKEMGEAGEAIKAVEPLTVGTATPASRISPLYHL